MEEAPKGIEEPPKAWKEEEIVENEGDDNEQEEDEYDEDNMEEGEEGGRGVKRPREEGDDNGDEGPSSSPTSPLFHFGYSFPSRVHSSDSLENFDSTPCP